jgi:hypothetical protein
MSSAKDMRAQLGMYPTTARHKLNRLIMFSLVQKSGLDLCFRCGEKILTPKELSVDHKLPWFRISTELFWDLENIAFSHFSCNSEEGRSRNPSNTRNPNLIAPDGMLWCSRCKDYRHIEDFSPSRRKSNVGHVCRKCVSDKEKTRYSKAVNRPVRGYRQTMKASKDF